MFKKSTALLIILILTTVILGGCKNSQNDKNMYSATVESESFYITSETSGRVIELNLEQGKEIKKGDILVKVDSSLYQLQKTQAEATYKIATAKLEELPDNVKDSLKKQVQGNVEAAKAGVDLAQLQIDRSTIKGYENGIISQVFIHLGEMTAPGMNVAKAINLKNRYIKVYIEESKRNSVKLRGSIDIYANGKKIDTGKVSYISPESEFTPKNIETKSEKEKTLFEVKIALSENVEAAPGSMVEVKVE